jgi:hypothetical protein
MARRTHINYSEHTHTGHNIAAMYSRSLAKCEYIRVRWTYTAFASPTSATVLFAPKVHTHTYIIYITVVWSVALYGCETWTMKEEAWTSWRLLKCGYWDGWRWAKRTRRMKKYSPWKTKKEVLCNQSWRGKRTEWEQEWKVLFEGTIWLKFW